MAARPVFHVDIGRSLAKAREDRDWSQAQAVDIAERRKLKIGLGALRFLEEGKTKHPDAEVLRVIATLYELSYADLVTKFTEANYGIHVGATTAGGAGVPPAKGTFVAEGADFAYVAIMKDRIAAGHPLLIADDNVDGALAFQTRFAKRWKRPVCVRVGPREESMMPLITPDDVVLLECADDARLRPESGGIYAVRIDGGATLKRVDQVKQDGHAWLVLLSENPDKRRYPVRMVPIGEGESVLDYIVGRVVWHGQYI